MSRMAEMAQVEYVGVMVTLFVKHRLEVTRKSTPAMGATVCTMIAPLWFRAWSCSLYAFRIGYAQLQC